MWRSPAGLAGERPHRNGEKLKAGGTRNGKVETYTVPLANARETNDGAVAREWAVCGYRIAMKSMRDIGTDLRAARLNIVLPE